MMTANHHPNHPHQGGDDAVVTEDRRSDHPEKDSVTIDLERDRKRIALVGPTAIWVAGILVAISALACGFFHYNPLHIPF